MGIAQSKVAREPLKILYQDEDLVAIHKPCGLLVHRTPQARDRTTCMHLIRDQLEQYVYPLHRLDRQTSGVLMFALNRETASQLGKDFQNNLIQKYYGTVVRGWPKDHFEVDTPLDDKPAHTQYWRFSKTELDLAVRPFKTSRYSWVVAKPTNGLLHQIRRHLHRSSYPVVGDRQHGDNYHNRNFETNFKVRRLLLFALGVRLKHPRTGEWISITTLPDARMRGLLDHIGLSWKESIDWIAKRLQEGEKDG